MKNLLFLLTLTCGFSLIGQDSIWVEPPTVSFNSFVDVYYAYDFNTPQNNIRQPFEFNHNRHNEFAINLALLSVNLEHQKYRGNFGIQAGTYANDNYSSEPLTIKNIFEANVGVSLNKKNTIWLDAGIFGSHLGFESAISIDNPTHTRSLVAESSPYFLSGAKFTFEPNHSWTISGTICNGWQRIKRIPGNSIPGFGTQIVYHPSKKMNLNWSTFGGSEDPDSVRRMFYFNNVYAQLHVSNKFYLITGFDFGYKQTALHSSDYNMWLGTVAILQYRINDKWAAAIRGEYFDDKHEIIIATGSPNGFKTSGASLNFDYSPTSRLACRLEGRWFNSKDRIFIQNGYSYYDNVFVVGSLALKLEK